MSTIFLLDVYATAQSSQFVYQRQLLRKLGNRNSKKMRLSFQANIGLAAKVFGEKFKSHVCFHILLD